MFGHENLDAIRDFVREDLTYFTDFLQKNEAFSFVEFWLWADWEACVDHMEMKFDIDECREMLRILREHDPRFEEFDLEQVLRDMGAIDDDE